MKFIIGAGLAGCSIASFLQNEDVTIIDQASHIGGACYDYFNNDGVMIQAHGPHSFFSNDKQVIAYISKFAHLIPFELTVEAHVLGEDYQLPINFNTIKEFFPFEIADKLITELASKYTGRVNLSDLDDSFEVFKSVIFKYFYKEYSAKQWERDVAIDDPVLQRVPIAISCDPRYHDSKYEFIPELGFTKLCYNMLGKKRVILNKKFTDVFNVEDHRVYFGNKDVSEDIYFTGSIDDLFNYELGVLPYRSLKHIIKHYDFEQFQNGFVTNYPNNYDFTRIIEFKHLPNSNKSAQGTTVAYEYPQVFDFTNTRYYPIETKENIDLYNAYRDLNKDIKYFGRLAQYKYMNMSDVIKQIITFFNP